MIKELKRAWTSNPNNNALTGDLDYIIDKINEIIERLNKLEVQE